MKQKISDKKETGKVKTQETPVTVESGQPEMIQNIELSMIVCNSFNPRKYRTEEDLEELKQSIVNFGIIQPFTLRVKGETYEIVCGERRFRASLKAGISTIPAIVKNYSDEEAMEICILENLQRRDINPVEDVKRLVREKTVPGVDFQPLEEELLYYVMLSFTRKEHFAKLGITNQYSFSDEEKAGIIPSLTTEQKNIIHRDFIVKHLSDTSGNSKQSQLLLEFAALFYPCKFVRKNSIDMEIIVIEKQAFERMKQSFENFTCQVKKTLRKSPK
jgi:hypothetical protein